MDEKFDELRKEILDKVDESLNRIEDKIIDEQENNKTGVVILKYRENDPELKLIMNKNKMMSAIYELSNYRRELYKYGGGHNEIIVNKGSKVLTDEDFRNAKYEVKDNVSYIREQSVIDKLDEILGDLYNLIDEY